MSSFKTPLALLVSAALLAGGVYYFEFSRKSGQSQNPAVTPSITPLFGFKEAEVKGLSIKTLANTVVLEKSPSNPSWQLRSPQPAGPANEAIVVFLLNLFNSPRDRELTIPASRKAEFGFEQPLATIEIKLENQQMHTLILGKLNFDRTGLYAIVDPAVDPNADLKVMVVPTSFESAVSRPIAEWRSKPTPVKPPPVKPIPSKPQ